MPKSKATVPRDSIAGLPNVHHTPSSCQPTLPPTPAGCQPPAHASSAGGPRSVLDDSIVEILAENTRRRAEIFAYFNPITGEGSVGERVRVQIPDFPIPVQWLPSEMMHNNLVTQLLKAGTVANFLAQQLAVLGASVPEPTEDAYDAVVEQFTRLRCRYDFPFWAMLFVVIKPKGGGDDIHFRLTHPQRRLVERFEKMRLANKPIRIVLLKARQWGGSTTSQLYMAWLQLVHKVGLNSLIIAHQSTGSDEINDMFDKMIREYPVHMLHEPGEAFQENEPKFVGVGKSGAIHRVPQRKCKIKVGTAERPDSCRSGDYNLVHLSEVGVWKETDGKKPEDIVQSACSGIRLAPYTMIVYESTAKGSDNFFHREYRAAKEGRSQFEAMFVSWYDIEWNEIPITSTTLPNALKQPNEPTATVARASGAGLSPIERFAKWLYDNKDQDTEPSDREDSGRYIWSLWKRGATLEAINWYIQERAGKAAHEIMCSENPTDDREAFTFTGLNVFSEEKIEPLRATCRPPYHIGEVQGEAIIGEKALENLHFVEDRQKGKLMVWSLPDPPATVADGSALSQETITNRYLVVVDVGAGRTKKADLSDILVIDRLGMLDIDGLPAVAAEWYGRVDMDILAWKAAQIAAFYDNALLVIESNTHETHADGYVTSDNSEFIFNQIASIYENMYARASSAENIRPGTPRKYGFHTNTKTKPLIIEGLKVWVRDRLWIERNTFALDEFCTYIQTEKGVYQAAAGLHDDRVMTRAIGLHICYNEMPLPQVIKKVSDRQQRLSPRTISAATIA